MSGSPQPEIPSASAPGAQAPLAVEVSGLHKVFRTSRREGVHAVQGISLNIREGEVYGLIGPNGAGKSTTMKAILGLLAPTRGECRVFGLPSTLAIEKGLMGYLPENPYFYRHLSGRETLAFYGKLAGLRRQHLAREIDRLLALVGLDHAAKRRVGTYSKGMLQRIGLAQALIGDPRLVILDEPTAGVDPVGSREIRDMILAMKQRGLTVLLCSHLLEQVQEVCDSVGIIARGQLLVEGRMADLTRVDDQRELVVENCPESSWRDMVATFLASNPQVRVVRDGHPGSSLETLFLKALAHHANSSESSPDRH